VGRPAPRRRLAPGDPIRRPSPCPLDGAAEHGLHDKAANDAILRFAARKATLPELPPRVAYTSTVAAVAGAVEPEAHRRAVRHWAEATWQDWADQHDFIRRWAAAAD
jgi:hypothetical protein